MSGPAQTPTLLGLRRALLHGRPPRPRLDRGHVPAPARTRGLVRGVWTDGAPLLDHQRQHQAPPHSLRTRVGARIAGQRLNSWHGLRTDDVLALRRLPVALGRVPTAVLAARSAL